MVPSQKELDKPFIRYATSPIGVSMEMELNVFFRPEKTPEDIKYDIEIPANRIENTAMTNHDMFVSAMKSQKGKTLTTRKIGEILLEAFPDFDKGSLLPNDHGEGNKSCCPCAGTTSRVFERVCRGIYFVR